MDRRQIQLRIGLKIYFLEKITVQTLQCNVSTAKFLHPRVSLSKKKMNPFLHPSKKIT